MNKKTLIILTCVLLNLTTFASETVRIASYNIRICANKTYYDEKIPDYRSIATIINDIDADVIGIQEVDSCTLRTGYVDQLKSLAQRTDMNYFHAVFRNMPTNGRCGNGILYKKNLKPIKSWTKIFEYNNERTGSVGVLEFENFVVACTHFSTEENVRFNHINIVNQLFEDYGSKPVFIVGDFNAEPNSEEMKLMKIKWNVISPEKFTYKANHPEKCIDYICCKKTSGRVQILNKKVVDHVADADVSKDSDHLPVYVDVEVNTDKPMFAGGDGTKENPYLIQTALQLDNIRFVDWNKVVENKQKVYFKLIDDIDLKGMDWEPIRSTAPYCHAIFDGNDHIIKNMNSCGYVYASLFGVLCGACKNLGLIDVNIESPGQGVGAFAGYVGLKTPLSENEIGTIECCFSSGTISASNAVGGIAGNIGKNFSEHTSYIKDCYSTCNVSTTRGTSNGGFCGGIVGYARNKSTLKNSYATGEIIAINGFGSGGIVGYSEENIENCFALNSSISNASDGPIGRIAAKMVYNGTYQPQGINCFGSDNIILDNGGTTIPPSHFGNVGNNEPYDGITKTLAALQAPSTYNGLWDMENIWSFTDNCKYPLLKWVCERYDCDKINGHAGIDDITPNKDEVRISASNGILHIEADEQIQSCEIYNLSGGCIFNSVSTAQTIDINLNSEKFVIVKMVLNDKTIVSKVMNYNQL